MSIGGNIMTEKNEQYVETTATTVNEESVDEMSKKIDQLVKVKQLPVIAQELATVKGEIDARVEYVKTLKVNDKNFKFVKSELADIRKLFNALESKRKSVKKQILQPYEEFEPLYNELAKTPLQDAISYLDEQVKTQTKVLIDEKADKAREYYKGVCENLGINFVKFEQIGLNITLSVTHKKLCEQISAFFEKVTEELKLIDTQGEHKAEILVEYKKTLNVAQSITKVSERYKAIAEEQARIEAEKAEREKARENAKRNEDIRFHANVSCAVETPPEEMEQPPIQQNNVVEEPAPTAVPSLIKVPFAVYGTREQLQVAIPKIKTLLNELLSKGDLESYE